MREIGPRRMIRFIQPASQRNIRDSLGAVQATRCAQLDARVTGFRFGVECRETMECDIKASEVRRYSEYSRRIRLRKINESSRLKRT